MNVEIIGTYAMMNSAITSTIMNGNIALLSVESFSFVILQATKRQAPTGGVINAILSDNTMTIPKWIGLIPIPTAIGCKIGPRIISAAAISMNMPTTSMSRIINRRITAGLPVAAKRKSAIIWGTWFMARTQLRMLAVPMIRKKTPVIFARLTNIEGRSLTLMLLSMKNPTTMAYATATAAASVGVNTPLKIPPRIMIGISKGKIASLRPSILSLKVDFLPFGYPRLKLMMDERIMSMIANRIPGRKPAANNPAIETFMSDP